MDLISNSQYGTVLSIIRILVKIHQVLVEYNINYNVVNTTVGAGSSPERFEIAQLGKPALYELGQQFAFQCIFAFLARVGLAGLRIIEHS